MGRIVYDQIGVVLTPRPQGDYLLDAVDAGGHRHSGTFRLPFGRDELHDRVIGLARVYARGLTVATSPAGSLPGVRDVGVVDSVPPDAQEFGRALADALFVGGFGDAYDTARLRARRVNRGLRLVLSLAEAPELLPIPWELLWRPAGFVACQEGTPLIRHLDIGEPALPPPIDRAVRVLGIVASPSNLPPLDVEAERRRIEAATSNMAALGRVDLEWLDHATPDALHRAMRDSTFHVLHFVGHGGTNAAGEGALYLEDDDGRAAPVGTSALRTLLGGHHDLRVVVLNACHGARTTLSDPLAGLAFALIECGIPAVVAMQFAISDRAAISFADELYNSLVGLQCPIDAAVAEARMRVFLVSPGEFATPVLYMRDPKIELFRFLIPAVAAPIVAVVGHAITDHASGVLGSHHGSTTVGVKAAKTGVNTGRRLAQIFGGAAATTAAVVTTVAVWPEPEPATAATVLVESNPDAERTEVQAVVDGQDAVYVMWDEGQNMVVRGNANSSWAGPVTIPTEVWAGNNVILEEPTLALGWNQEPCLNVHRYGDSGHDMANGLLEWGLWQGCRHDDIWSATTSLMTPQELGLGGGATVSGFTYFSVAPTSDGVPHYAWAMEHVFYNVTGTGQLTFTQAPTDPRIRLVVDSADRIHAFYGVSERGVEHRVSRDSGRTWSDPDLVVASASTLRSVSDIRTDDSGGVHLLIHSIGNFDPSGLSYRRWDQQNGWQPPAVLFDDGQSTMTLPAEMGIVDGRPTVVWYPAGGALSLSRLSENGAFAPPKPIADAVDDAVIDVAVVTRGDQLHIIWLSDNGQITHQAFDGSTDAVPGG